MSKQETIGILSDFQKTNGGLVMVNFYDCFVIADCDRNNATVQDVVSKIICGYPIFQLTILGKKIVNERRCNFENRPIPKLRPPKALVRPMLWPKHF